MCDRSCVNCLSYFMIVLENTTMLPKAHVKSGGDIRVNGGTIYGKTSNVSKRKTNGMLHVRWKIDGI